MRSRAATGPETPAQDNFSALVDSNAAASAESRAESQPAADRTKLPERGQDASPAGEVQGPSGAPHPAKAAAKATDGKKPGSQPDGTTIAIATNEAQAAASVGADPAPTAPIAPVAEAALATVLAPGDTAEADTKDAKTHAKADDGPDVAVVVAVDIEQQPIPTSVPIAIVVAIVPESAAANSPPPASANNADAGTITVAAVGADAAAPGAIATARVNDARASSK